MSSIFSTQSTPTSIFSLYYDIDRTQGGYSFALMQRDILTIHNGETNDPLISTHIREQIRLIRGNEVALRSAETHLKEIQLLLNPPNSQTDEDKGHLDNAFMNKIKGSIDALSSHEGVLHINIGSVIYLVLEAVAKNAYLRELFIKQNTFHRLLRILYNNFIPLMMRRFHDTRNGGTQGVFWWGGDTMRTTMNMEAILDQFMLPSTYELLYRYNPTEYRKTVGLLAEMYLMNMECRYRAGNGTAPSTEKIMLFLYTYVTYIRDLNLLKMFREHTTDPKIQWNIRWICDLINGPQRNEFESGMKSSPKSELVFELIVIMFAEPMKYDSIKFFVAFEKLAYQIESFGTYKRNFKYDVFKQTFDKQTDKVMSLPPMKEGILTVMIPIKTETGISDLIATMIKTCCLDFNNTDLQRTKLTRDGIPVFVLLGMWLTRIHRALTCQFLRTQSKDAEIDASQLFQVIVYTRKLRI